MILVDMCNFHQAYIHPSDIDSDSNTVWTGLAEEMADNRLDEISLRARHTCSNVATRDSSFNANIAIHLTPTTERKRKQNGDLTNYMLLGNRRICRKKDIICMQCMWNGMERQSRYKKAKGMVLSQEKQTELLFTAIGNNVSNQVININSIC